MDYQALEPTISSSIGVEPVSFNNNSNVSFFTSSSFLYALFFVVIVVAASYRYALAGMLRIQATEEGIRKSKEEFTRVTYGLLGVFGLWLILATVNKDMLTGDVGLGALKSTITSAGGGYIPGQTPVTPPTTNPTTPQNTEKCLSENETKSALSSSVGICGNTRCTTFVGCNYKQYDSIIIEEAKRANINPNLIRVIMCKESRGKKDVQNSKNNNGTYDCGLMQINQNKPCDEASYNVTNNIRAGATLIKSKLSAVSGGVTYPGIPVEAKMFASYACCGGGINPNSESNDCTTSSGYPFTPPKWACPKNPGPTNANMCFVRQDVCGALACLKELDS